MNLKELADKIEKKAGVKVLNLPVGVRFITRTPNGTMEIIAAGEKWPIPSPVKGEDGKVTMRPDGSLIMALFHGDDDVRAYTLSTEEKSSVMPTRYTLSKHQPSIFAEIMTIDTFIDEIASEWVVIDEGNSSVERERAAVIAFLQAHITSSGYELAIKIQAEEHIEKDDEDDEEEGVVTSAPAAS